MKSDKYFLSLVPKIICISSVQDSCLQFVNKSPNSFLTIFQTNVLTLAFAQWQITHFHFHGVLTLGQNFKFDEVRSKSVLIFIFEYFGRVNISTLKFWNFDQFCLKFELETLVFVSFGSGSNQSWGQDLPSFHYYWEYLH